MLTNTSRVFSFLSRSILHRVAPPPKYFPSKSHFFSTKPRLSLSHDSSQYRKQISLANLLQRYGFSHSQLHSFICKNKFLLNSNLQDIERSLSVLLSFKVTQKSLVSLINDCPGVLDFKFLKEWDKAVQNIEELGVPPSVVANILALSRKFQIEPYMVFESVKALKGLGFSEGAVRRVLEGFPTAIMMNEDEICKRIEFLRRIGFPAEGIERGFYLFPEFLGLSVEERLKPLLNEFCDLGFSEDLIIKEIIREPRILSMELGEFSRCLELLKTMKCREPIKVKILSEGAFRAGYEVKLRVDCLCKHGLICREAFKVLWKEPRVILYKIEEIEKKIEFLVHRMKYDVGCLFDVPEYLGVNFDKQIVSRYNVIEYLRGKGGLGSEVSLKDLIKPSRLRFYNLYVKSYPECEKMFGRFSGDKVKSRHPAGLWKLFKPPSYTQSKEEVENMKAFVESLV